MCRHRMLPARFPRTVLAIWSLSAGLLAWPATTALGQVNLVSSMPGEGFTVTAGGQVTYDVDNGLSCDAVHCQLHAPLDVPHGATLLGIEVAACSDLGTDTDLRVEVARRYLVGNAFGPSVTTLASVEVAPEVGCVVPIDAAEDPASPGDPVIVNRFEFDYVVAVSFGYAVCGVFGAPPCPGQQPRFFAVRAYYLGAPNGRVVPNQPVTPIFAPP